MPMRDRPNDCFNLGLRENDPRTLHAARQAIEPDLAVGVGHNFDHVVILQTVANGWHQLLLELVALECVLLLSGSQGGHGVLAWMKRK